MSSNKPQPQGRGYYHAADCACQICTQLNEASTTKDNRVRFTIDLTEAEVESIIAAGEEYGLGRKPMTERIVREWLACRS